MKAGTPSGYCAPLSLSASYLLYYLSWDRHLTATFLVEFLVLYITTLLIERKSLLLKNTYHLPEEWHALKSLEHTVQTLNATKQTFLPRIIVNSFVKNWFWCIETWSYTCTTGWLANSYVAQTKIKLMISLLLTPNLAVNFVLLYFVVLIYYCEHVSVSEGSFWELVL